MRGNTIGICLALTLGAATALAWTEPTSVTWTLSTSSGALVSGSDYLGSITSSGMTIDYGWDRPTQTAKGTFHGDSYTGLYPPFLEMLWDNQTSTLLHIAISPQFPASVYRLVGACYTDVATTLIDEYFSGARDLELLIPAGLRAEFYVSMGPPSAPCNTLVTVTYGEGPVAATPST